MKKLLVLIGLSLVSVGPLALLAPQTAAFAFGIPSETSEAKAYLWATALRDVSLGIWLLALLALGASPRILAVSLWAMAIIPAGDAIIVLTQMGWQGSKPIVIHLGGFILLPLLGWRFWRTQRV